MDELIDVYDKFGNKNGMIKEKSDVKKDGDFHRAISVLIMNKDREILFQKLSGNKKVFPNLWTMFLKGHIELGENAIDAAIREIFEEIGIIVGYDEIEYLYTIKDCKKIGKYHENIFFDTFLLVKNINIKDIKMNDEITNVQFVPLPIVKALIENQSDEIAPNYKDYSIIFNYINNGDKNGNMGLVYRK